MLQFKMYISTKMRTKVPLSLSDMVVLDKRIWGIINSITFLLIFSSEKNKAENILALLDWVSYHCSKT